MKILEKEFGVKYTRFDPNAYKSRINRFLEESLQSREMQITIPLLNC